MIIIIIIIMIVIIIINIIIVVVVSVNMFCHYYYLRFFLTTLTIYCFDMFELWSTCIPRPPTHDYSQRVHKLTYAWKAATLEMWDEVASVITALLKTQNIKLYW